MSFSTSPYPDSRNEVTDAAPDELRPEGWTDAELWILGTDVERPEGATGIDRSGTPGIQWRRVVCLVKGHYPVEVLSSERHHHTECGRCPKQWLPEAAPLPAESHIV
jgi:hypothetical protein